MTLGSNILGPDFLLQQMKKAGNSLAISLHSSEQWLGEYCEKYKPNISVKWNVFISIRNSPESLISALLLRLLQEKRLHALISTQIPLGRPPLYLSNMRKVLNRNLTTFENLMAHEAMKEIN